MKFLLAPVALASLLAVAACSGDSAAPEAEAAPAPESAITEPEAPAAAEPAITEPVVIEPVITDAVTSPEPEPADVTEPETIAPDAMAPIDPTRMLTPEALSDMQAQVDALSDDEKRAAVEQARATAEDAARQQGLPEAMIGQMGEQAEAAARQMFGLDE